jgi:hypothetical protein
MNCQVFSQCMNTSYVVSHKRAESIFRITGFLDFVPRPVYEEVFYFVVSVCSMSADNILMWMYEVQCAV